MTRNAKVSLHGIIDSVEPSDPEGCFNRPASYYNGLGIITAQVDGQETLLHACGDTNTGFNFNGCFHGVDDLGGGGGTHDISTNCLVDNPTGEKVIAQSCVLECGYVIDHTYDPIVLVAKIGSNWYIINVLDGDNLNPPGTPPCHTGLCCNPGRKDLIVSLSGCTIFAGHSMTLSSGSGSGLSWSGTLIVGDDSLSVSIFCNEFTGYWTVIVSSSLGSPSVEYDFNCGASNTGSGSASEGIGSFTATFPSGQCGSITGSVSIGTESYIDRCVNITELTGERVIVEACGLGMLKYNDKLIVARVPKIGRCSGSSTATGSDCDVTIEDNTDCPPTLTEEERNPQWQVILACTSADCEPCPPPPPPPESECCGLDPIDIPSTLSGTIKIRSNINECDCNDEVPISFTLLPGSVPAEWYQDEPGIGCDGETGSGSGAPFLLSLIGMVVRCQHGGSGSNSGSGSGSGGSGASFGITYPGCSKLENQSVDSSNASCDPVYMEFDIEAPGCCGPITGVEVRVSVHIELAGV